VSLYLTGDFAMRAILVAAAIGLTGIPGLVSLPVKAQALFELGTYRLDQGTIIPVGSLSSEGRQYTPRAIAEDAAIGAAAGVLLGALTGNLSPGNVLGGAVAGVVVGNVTAPRVVVLRPGQSFYLTLEAPLAL
jgi:hypothetical protein